MSPKLFIKTFGCQMNEYDSQKMLDVLHEAEGYTLTENAEEADVLLLNTCSIREKAQEKVFSQLGRWRPFKQKNPQLMIGVGGCVASQEGEAIRARATCRSGVRPADPASAAGDADAGARGSSADR